MRLWLSEHPTSEGSGSERISDVPEVGDFDSYVADFKGMGGQEIFDLTVSPDLGHQSSIPVGEQLVEVFSTSNISISAFVVGVNRLHVWSVPSLSYCPAVHMAGCILCDMETQKGAYQYTVVAKRVEGFGEYCEGDGS